MSLQVKISLTDSGNRPPSTVFKLYGNLDNYSTQIGSDILLSELTDDNNPYFVTVDDGTTNLRLSDGVDNCLIDLTISEVDFCVEANFTFSSDDNNLIGRIDVGDLLSNNQGLTDYRIFWYNENDEVSYISGFGNEFTPYSFTHPLTGVNSIFAQAGTYQPIIDKVRIDGVNYSQSDDTSNPIPVDVQGCLGDYTVSVSPFNCSNGENVESPNNNGVEYSHRVNFQASSNDPNPLALDSTFEIGPDVNYFAYSFKGENVPDTIKVSFLGGSYQEPIGLSFVSVGLSLPPSSYNELPYSNKTDQFNRKVISLVGFDRSPSDSLLIEVTPNENDETNWDLFLTCLGSDFDSSLSCVDFNGGFTKLNKNNLTVTESTEFCYEHFRLDLGLISDCVENGQLPEYATVNDSVGTSPLGLYPFTGVRTSCSIPLVIRNTLDCETIEPYWVKKVGNLLTFVFTDMTNFNEYYGDFVYMMNTNWSSDNPPQETTLDYYTRVELFLADSVDFNCGDNLSRYGINIHPSSTYSSGTTLDGNPYFEIDLVELQNQYQPEDTCNACANSVNNTVLNVNNTKNLSDFDSYYDKGSFYSYMISRKSEVSPVEPRLTNNEFRYVSGLRDSYVTEPFSGNTDTPNIPNLNNSVMDSGFVNNFEYYGITEKHLIYCYRVTVLSTPIGVSDFEIYALKPNMGVYPNPTLSTTTTDGSFELVYTGNMSDPTNGTIINPNYFV